MTPFRKHQDVAAVEYGANATPLEGCRVLPATVTEVGLCSVTARLADGTQMFLLDSHGRAWCDGGWWRLVPLCHRYGEPVTGTPVTDDDDLLHRAWCSEECRDAAAEAYHEGHYPSGVAT